MMREKLPNTRPALSVDLKHKIGGNDHGFSATFGFNEKGHVRECFCLAFKSGTDLQTLLHHACVAISVGLQHGSTMAEFLKAMGEEDLEKPPRSILGLIVRAGANIEAQGEVGATA